MARKKEKKEMGSDRAGAANPTRITPVEIQKKEFRVAMRGYHEQDVDQFLDDVTEEVARLYAENKRLREELEFAGTRRMDLGAAGEAEAVLREAQEAADRILAEARARAAAMQSTRSGAAGSPLREAASLRPYISREREFLQSLADLIQSHAEAVKEQLRQARDAVAADLPSEPAVARSDAGSDSGPPTQSWVMSPTGEGEGPGGDQTASREIRDRGEVSFQDRASEPAITGQDWTQYYSGPTEAMETSGTFTMEDAAAGDAGTGDDILDLTQESGLGGDSGGAYTADAVPRRAPPTDELDDEDRSIRELFWGED